MCNYRAKRPLNVRVLSVGIERLYVLLAITVAMVISLLPLGVQGQENDPVPRSYVLYESDVVLIEVFDEPQMNGRYTVTEQGMISFPLIGDIQALGLTENGLESLLTEALRGRYLTDPRVTVRIVKFRNFFVSGAVSNPGSFPYVPGITLRQAISLAGGKSEQAGRMVEIVGDEETYETEDLETPVSPGDVITIQAVLGCPECVQVTPALDIAGGAPEGSGYIVGSGVIYPAVTISEEYDDNIFRSNENTRSSFITTLKPDVYFQGGEKLWGYQLGYSGAYGVYHSSSADNFDDHALSAQTSASITGNSRLQLLAALIYGHSRRGDDLSEGLALTRSEPDRFRRPELEAMYAYEKGRTNFDAELGYFDLTYLNNRVATESRDREEARLYGRAGYSIRSMLDLFTSFEHRVIDYASRDESDGDASEILVGVEYDVVDRITAEIGVGGVSRRFDLSDDDISEPTYSGSIEWYPNTRDTWEAGFKRDIGEPTTPGDQIRTIDRFFLIWNRKLSSRLESEVEAQYRQEERENDLFERRRDDGYGLSMGLEYRLRYWASAGLDYHYRKRDSNDDQFDFVQNVVRATFQARF